MDPPGQARLGILDNKVPTIMFTPHRFSDRIHWVTGPANGMTLVMFHGVIRRWQTYLPILPALSARYRIVAVDHRGHGESARAADGRYFVADYVADAVEFVRSLPGPIALYGHSLGGMVAAGVAANLPGHIAAAVLEDPPFATMGRRIEETPLLSHFQGMQRLAGATTDVASLAEAVGAIRVTDPRSQQSSLLRDTRDAASLRFTAACLRKLDPKVIAPIVEGRWLEGYDARAMLSRIECPTLLLKADARLGGMLTDDEAAMAVSALRNSAVVPFPNAGHVLHAARTQDVLNATFAFLSTLE